MQEMWVQSLGGDGRMPGGGNGNPLQYLRTCVCTHPTLLCPNHNSPRGPHVAPSGTMVAEGKENQGLPPPNQLPGRALAKHQDRSSWRRKWQPTPVFLSGKSHGHMSLVGYSLWGHKESDTTE